MINMNITIGRAVPTEKNDGNKYPYVYDKDKGINVPKNRTNIVGQKAKEKKNPSKNEPTSFWFRINLIEKKYLPFIIPDNSNPIKINKGPIIFRNHGKYKVNIC